MAQKTQIDKVIEKAEALSHFKFLASDELKGRDPERHEIDIAAYYIANQFEKYGANPLSSLNAYYQYVPFVSSSPPTVGDLKWKGSKFKHGEDLLVLGGKDLSGDGGCWLWV